MVVAGGWTRSEMLMPDTVGVVNKEGMRRKRGRNTVELNQNQTLDQNRDQDLDWIYKKKSCSPFKPFFSLLLSYLTTHRKGGQTKSGFREYGGGDT